MTLSTAHGPGRISIKGYFYVSGPQSDDYEGRGLPPYISNLFKEASVQQVSVVTSEEGHEHSAVYARMTDDPNYVAPVEVKKDLLPKNMVAAWFESAGFKRPETMYELVNEYDPERDDSWWLVKTELGLIKIGWRKRVICIDWSETPIRKLVTTDDVTKDETMVHAWSVGEAIKYLTTLRQS